MISAGTNQAPHVPVLISEVIGALALHEADTAVDGTFGAGGYTRAMTASKTRKRTERRELARARGRRF